MSTTNPRDIETEWDSLQRKYGNLPPKPVTVTEEERTKQLVDQLEQVDVLETKSLKQLEELEDDLTEDTLEKYRQRRLQELKQRVRRNRFGELLHLGKDEFVEEVTKASAVYSDATEETDTSSFEQQQQQQQQQKGTWVVVHLYQDSVTACTLINRCLARVAARNKSIKFMKAKSTDIIPNYPDARLPTILIYFGGVCQKQTVGAEQWGGNAVCVRSIEKALRRLKVLESCESDSGESEGEEAGSSSRHQQDDDRSDSELERVRSKGYTSVRLDGLLNRRL